jgi:hypothetical protein
MCYCSNNSQSTPEIKALTGCLTDGEGLPSLRSGDYIRSYDERCGGWRQTMAFSEGPTADKHEACGITAKGARLECRIRLMIPRKDGPGGETGDAGCGRTLNEIGDPGDGLIRPLLRFSKPFKQEGVGDAKS